jgi:metal-dependent HD superfamily phosphatase/phosphodiesterase
MAALKKTKNHFRSITVPLEKNPLLEQVLEKINANLEIKTLWHVLNVNAIQRLGMTDHGPVHFQIVANTSLRLLRLLQQANIKPSSVKDFNLTQDHAEVVVLLASLLHDTGMSINRKGHEEFSIILTNTLLKEILDFMPIEERTIMISETLHAIISHRSEGQPLTIEAGIVRVADALDMSKGRSRIPYEAGKIDIHSVSAQAIDSIEIMRGRNSPVQIDIIMNHTAGIFQVDDLLKKKVNGSGIEAHLDIKIFMDKGEGKQLFKDFYKKSS